VALRSFKFEIAEMVFGVHHANPCITRTDTVCQQVAEVDDLSYDIALTLCQQVAEVEIGRSARRGVGAWYHKIVIDLRLECASHR
jgi:hypothetical protein